MLLPYPAFFLSILGRAAGSGRKIPQLKVGFSRRILVRPLHIMLEVILFFIGVFVGWAIQHFYSARSAKEQRTLFHKLSSDLRDLILSDPREQLSVAELNQLINRRTIDPNQEGPLPYVACPKCGSTNIERRESLDAERDEMYYIVTCKDCGWSDWSQ